MIAVFFGGKSCEHDISIITGLQALSACRSACAPVYIDRDGVWWTGDGFDSVNAVKNKKFKGKSVHIRPGEPYLYCRNKRLFKIDAALVCMHGMLGEDGCIQGLFKMSGIPFTGSDVLASAIGMNKLYSKRVFEAAGLKVVPYMPITRTEYETDISVALEALDKSIGMPVIVKPCNLGSSIGISIAHDRHELFEALRVAFEWDDTVIAEKALEGFTEVNCAVLGESEFGECKPSDTEQPVGWKNFLTFKDKYSGDVKSTRHKIPADIDAALDTEIKAQAVRAFTAVGCSGVARIDFMVKGADIYVNEINTVPGSLSSALFRSDMEFARLIDRLLELAKERSARADRLKRVYTPLEPIIGK